MNVEPPEGAPETSTRMPLEFVKLAPVGVTYTRFVPLVTVPLTWSGNEGDAVPIPTLPPVELIAAVLPSNSNTEFTSRFQEAERRVPPVEVRSAVVSPELSVAYPMERMPRVPKKVSAESAGFLKLAIMGWG
jgi:hypothetical protein